MYTMYSDSSLVYAPNLANEEDGGYAVIDPVVTSALNSVGSLKFKMPEVNPMYDGISKMKSIIKVYDERVESGITNRTRIFRGRVLDDECDLLNRKEVYAESDIGFFNDSRVRPYKFTGTVQEYFTFLVTQHNSQVEAEKQFRVGVCTVDDGNDTIFRESSEYPKTWQEMKDKLLDLLGGYLITRYEVEDGQEVEYIDYLAVSGGLSAQDIVFAENLLDIKNYVDATNVFTVLIPLGKSDSNTGERLTVKSVNDNKDYIESEIGIALYGRISSVITWDDVTDAQNLLAKGQAQLADGILSAITINIGAFDLHLLSVDTEALKVGKYNRVISVPHRISAPFQCIKTAVNLKDPSKSEYTFGAATTTLTGTSAKNAVSGAYALSEASAANVAANATANALNIALAEIASDYVTKTTYDSLEARVAALEGN